MRLVEKYTRKTMESLKTTAENAIVAMLLAELAEAEKVFQNHLDGLYIADWRLKRAMKRSDAESHLFMEVPWEEYLKERCEWRAKTDALRQEIDGRYKKVFDLLKIE